MLRNNFFYDNLESKIKVIKNSFEWIILEAIIITTAYITI